DFSAFLCSQCLLSFCVVFFFFSSRRRHTRFSRDWSSDVCSSDLHSQTPAVVAVPRDRGSRTVGAPVSDTLVPAVVPERRGLASRSEERRVGKECRSRRGPYH